MKFHKVLIAILSLVLLVPSISAVTYQKFNPMEFDKPDLVIVGLSHHPDTVMWQNVICCTVKNIGNTTVTGFVDLKVEIKRVYFGIFLNNKSIQHYSVNMYSTHGLPPGESWEQDFALDIDLPFWGFFRLYCWVNPNHTIEESNYSNNFYQQQVHVRFGNWIGAI